MRDKAAEIPVTRNPGAAGGDGDGGMLGVSGYFSGRAHLTTQPTGVRPLAALRVNLTTIPARDNVVHKS